MKGSFITLNVTKDPFIAPTHNRRRDASPRHELSACHPVDLAKPDHAVSRACEKHEIAKVMALDAV